MFSLRKINRSYRNIQRIREIVATMVRYGFEEIVAQTRLKGMIARSLRRRVDPNLLERSRWERVRLLLEELGPTFVKFGQVLSNRPDLIPQPLLVELEQLQDQVAPFSSAEVEQILQEAWGGPWQETLSQFDAVPIAAASMAQVHFAILKEGQERVALKVRRPGAEQTVEADLEILHAFAQWAEQHLDAFRKLHLLPVISEFEQKIRSELDFRIEANHLRRFAEQYGKEPRLKVPRVYPELVRDNLLVLDFIDGISISKVDLLREAGHNLPALAKTGCDLILKQIFEHGFFHADPHPGNIFVLRGGVLAFLDFGMVGVLSTEQREELADLLIAVESRDARRLSRTLQRISYQEAPDYQRFHDEVQELLLDYSSIPSSELNMGRLIQSLSGLLTRHRIQLPPAYFLLFKALLSLEGISRELDPQFDLLKELSPYIVRLVTRKLRPDRLARSTWHQLGDISSALRGLPDEAVALVRQAKRGELGLRFEHEGLEPFRKGVQESVDRLAMAVVLAALLISSSVVILAKLPPLVYDIPIFGLIGYVAAGLIALYLLLTALFRRN